MPIGARVRLSERLFVEALFHRARLAVGSGQQGLAGGNESKCDLPDPTGGLLGSEPNAPRTSHAQAVYPVRCQEMIGGNRLMCMSSATATWPISGSNRSGCSAAASRAAVLSNPSASRVAVGLAPENNQDCPFIHPGLGCVQSIPLTVRHALPVLWSTHPTVVEPHGCVVLQTKPTTVWWPKGIAFGYRMAALLHPRIALP